MTRNRFFAFSAELAGCFFARALGGGLVLAAVLAMAGGAWAVDINTACPSTTEVCNLTNGEEYTGYATGKRLNIPNNVSVTFNNLTVVGDLYPAVSVATGTNGATITLKGTNDLKGGIGGAALRVPSSAKVTIEGPGTLVATGGMWRSLIGTDAGAGIGGGNTGTTDGNNANNRTDACGTVMINGGTIRAYGGGSGESSNNNEGRYTFAAGIGGSGNAAAGCYLVINGGNVTAVGGSPGRNDIGAGIRGTSATPDGTGTVGTIGRTIINGGSVNANIQSTISNYTVTYTAQNRNTITIETGMGAKNAAGANPAYVACNTTNCTTLSTTNTTNNISNNTAVAVGAVGTQCVICTRSGGCEITSYARNGITAFNTTESRPVNLVQNECRYFTTTVSANLTTDLPQSYSRTSASSVTGTETIVSSVSSSSRGNNPAYVTHTMTNNVTAAACSGCYATVTISNNNNDMSITPTAAGGGCNGGTCTGNWSSLDLSSLTTGTRKYCAQFNHYANTTNRTTTVGAFTLTSNYLQITHASTQYGGNFNTNNGIRCVEFTITASAGTVANKLATANADQVNWNRSSTPNYQSSTALDTLQNTVKLDTLQIGTSYPVPNSPVTACKFNGKDCFTTSGVPSGGSYGIKDVVTNEVGKVYFWLPSNTTFTDKDSISSVAVSQPVKYGYNTTASTLTLKKFTGQPPTFISDATTYSLINEFSEYKFAVGHPIYIKTGNYARRDGPEESPSTHTYKVTRYQGNVTGSPQCIGGAGEANGTLNVTTQTINGFSYNAIYTPNKEDFGCYLNVSITPKWEESGTTYTGVERVSPMGQVGAKVTITPETENSLTFVTDKQADFVWNEGSSGNKLESMLLNNEKTRVIYDFSKPFTLKASVAPSGIKYIYSWSYKLNESTASNTIAIEGESVDEQAANRYKPSNTYKYNGDAGDLKFFVRVQDGEPPTILHSDKGSISLETAVKNRLNNWTADSVRVIFSEKLQENSEQIIRLVEQSDKSSNPHNYISGDCKRSEVACNDAAYCDKFISTSVTRIACPHEAFSENGIYRLTFTGFRDDSENHNLLDDTGNNTVYIATPGKGSLDDNNYYIGTTTNLADNEKIFTINSATNPNINVKANYSPSNSGALTGIQYFWQVEDNIANQSGCLDETDFNEKYSASSAEDKGDLNSQGVNNVNGALTINKVFKPKELGKYIRIVMRPIGTVTIGGSTNGIATCGLWKRIGVVMYATNPEKLVTTANDNLNDTEIIVNGTVLGLASTKGTAEDGGYVVYNSVGIGMANKPGKNVITGSDRISYRWGYDAPTADAPNVNPQTNNRCDKGNGYCGISGNNFTPPPAAEPSSALNEPTGPIYITALFGDASPLKVATVKIGNDFLYNEGSTTKVSKIDGSQPLVITFEKSVVNLNPSSSQNTVWLKTGSNSLLLSGSWSNDGKTYTIPAETYKPGITFGGISHTIDVLNFKDESGNVLQAGSSYDFTSYKLPEITLNNNGINNVAVGVSIPFQETNVRFTQNDYLSETPSQYQYKWQVTGDPTVPNPVWIQRGNIVSTDDRTKITYKPIADDFAKWIRFVVWTDKADSARSTPIKVGVFLQSGTVTVPDNNGAFVSINGSNHQNPVWVADKATLTIGGLSGSYQITSYNWTNGTFCADKALLCTEYYPTDAQGNEAFTNGVIKLNATLIKADPPLVSNVTVTKFKEGGTETTTENGTAFVDPSTTMAVEFNGNVKWGTNSAVKITDITNGAGSPNSISLSDANISNNKLTIPNQSLNYDKKYLVTIEKLLGKENSVEQVVTHPFTFTTKSLPKITNKPQIAPNESALSAPAIGHNVKVSLSRTEVDGSTPIIENNDDYTWYKADTENGTYTEVNLDDDDNLDKSLFGKWIKVNVTPKSIYGTSVSGIPVGSDAVQVGVLVKLEKAANDAANGASAYNTAAIYINNKTGQDVVFGSPASNLTVSGQGTDKVTWSGTNLTATTGASVNYTPPTAPDGDITITAKFTNGVTPFATISSSEINEAGAGSITLAFDKAVTPVATKKYGLALLNTTCTPSVNLSSSSTASTTQVISGITGLSSASTYIVCLEEGAYVDTYNPSNGVVARNIGSFTTNNLVYAVTVSPNSKVFNSAQYGYANTGDWASQTVTITNTGSAGTSIGISAITTCPTNFTCELIGGSTTINKGETKQVKVTVNAGLSASSTAYSGTLEVTNDKGIDIKADLTFTVNKANIVPSVAVKNSDNSPSSQESPYNGLNRKIVVSNSQGISDVTIDNISGTVGTTNVSYTIIGNANYNDYNGSVPIKITPVSVTGYGISEIASVEYNRSAQMPSITFSSSPAFPMTFLEGTDYNLTYSNNINAGTATVTVTGKGNYTGNLNKTFTITKATLAVPEIAVNATYGDTYRDVLNSPTTNRIVTMKAADGFPVEGEWTFANAVLDTRISPSGSLTQNAGAQYNATVTPKQAAPNYTFEPSKPVTLTIAQKRLEITGFGWLKDQTGKDRNIRDYDGTTFADAYVNCGTANGIVSGDRAFYNCGVSYATKNAGQNKIAYPEFLLTGTHAGAYTFNSNGLILVGTIVEKNVQINGLSVKDKVYDGTRNAEFKTPFDPSTAQILGKIGTDDLYLATDPGYGPEFLNQYASLSDYSTDEEYTNQVRMKGIRLAGTDKDNYNLVFNDFRARIEKATVSGGENYFVAGTYGDVLGRINLTTNIRRQYLPLVEVQNIPGVGGETVWGTWGWASNALNQTVGKATDCRGIGNCLIDVEFVPSNPNYKTTPLKVSVLASPRNLEFTAAGMERPYEEGNNSVDLIVSIRNLIAADNLSITGTGTIPDPTSGVRPVAVKIEDLKLTGNIDVDNYVIPRPLTAGLIGSVVVNIEKADYCKGERDSKYTQEVKVGDVKIYCIKSIPSPYPNPAEMVYDTLLYPNLASIALPTGWSWSSPTKKIPGPSGRVSDEIKYTKYAAAMDTNYNSYYSTMSFNVLPRDPNSLLKIPPVVLSPCGADTARVTVVAESKYATIWFDNNQYLDNESDPSIGSFTKTGLEYGPNNKIEYKVRAQAYDVYRDGKLVNDYSTSYAISHTRLVPFSRVADWLRTDKKSLTVKLDSSQILEKTFFRKFLDEKTVPFEKRLNLPQTKWLKYTEGKTPEVVRTGMVYPVSAGSGDYSLVFYANDGTEAFASCTESGEYPVPPSWENVITPVNKMPTLIATPFGSRVVAGGTSLIFNTPYGGKVSIYTIKGELVSRTVVVENRTVVKIPATKGMYIVKLEAK